MASCVNDINLSISKFTKHNFLTRQPLEFYHLELINLFALDLLCLNYCYFQFSESKTNLISDPIKTLIMNKKYFNFDYNSLFNLYKL